MTKIRIPAMDIARRHPLFLKGTLVQTNTRLIQNVCNADQS